MKTKPALIEHKVDTKLILMAAWVAMMCLYIYCDYYTFYRPGYILESVAKGKMGIFDATQASLLVAGVLMIIPSLMIFITPLAPAKASRIINMLISPLYVLVNIGNIVAEVWAYYLLFGLIELGLVIGIFIMALRWPRQSS